MAGTKKRLLDHLRRGPATAQHLAKKEDISATAVRRHMEDWQEEGAASSFERREGVGRPKKYYRITPEGRELFPRRYDVAALKLVEALLEEHGTDGVNDAMHRVAYDLAEEMEDKVPDEGSIEERVDAVAELLKDLGFPTEIERDGDTLVIVRRDCIFLKLAHEHRDAVCQHLDTTLLQQLLGEDVELDGCLPDGRSSCRHVIE